MAESILFRGSVLKHFDLRQGKEGGDVFVRIHMSAECECSWGDAVLTDYRMVTCSNCYSERVAIVCLRLSFENWGEQNGGEREQRERYSTALGLTAGLTTKTQVMDNTRLA